jgi:hypothetical protein
MAHERPHGLIRRLRIRRIMAQQTALGLAAHYSHRGSLKNKVSLPDEKFIAAGSNAAVDVAGEII